MPKTIHYTLAFLQKDHLNAIFQICETQFGADFLSPTLLNSYLEASNKFCHVVLYEQQVIGFSLMQVSSREELAEKMQGEKEWFLNYFAAYPQIGYRSLTAVAKGFEGNGVASFLVQKGLTFLSNKVDVVICDAWKSTTVHIGSIPERNHCLPIKEIANFWTKESLEQNYYCNACGQPPCGCTAVIYAHFFKPKRPYWWERENLNYEQGYLKLGHSTVIDFAKNKTTPFYLYDVDRIVDKYQQIAHALASFDLDFKIYYAMKANRHPAILSHLKIRTHAGIDVCSPNELDWALQHSFSPTQISYTGTSLSNKDLSILAQQPNIAINFDSISAIRRFATLNPYRAIGIRINPNIGMAYNQSLEYSGNATVKFGIYQDQWQNLKTVVDASSLEVTTVHCHSGSGFLSDQLERLPDIFKVIDQFLALFPTVKTLNLGGGLGVPQNKGDQTLDLTKWASIIGDYAKKRRLTLAFEPGDFLVKDAGILVTQVNTVEQQQGKLFVGVDAGMNVNYEYAYYKMNLEAVPLVFPKNHRLIPSTLCGNINEPIDLFSEDKPLAIVEEGDYLALLNSGGYGASTSSNHCMRGDFKEYIICQ